MIRKDLPSTQRVDMFHFFVQTVKYRNSKLYKP